MGYLSAWIDFNADGDWNDNGERIVTNQTISGSIVLNIPIPATAITGTTYARFRFSTQQNLAPTGTAIDGEVEDYRIQIVARPNKTLVATSEAHSSGANLAIGEIARYRLVMQAPEGELTNFRITDNLPAYLQYLDNGTTRLAFVSTAAMTSTNSALDAAWVAGNETTLATITPAIELPAGAISGGPFVSGTDPIFNLGTLNNPDGDANREFVVVEFNALVVNVSQNQDGQTRANTYDVSYGSFLERSNTVTITVREPVLQITKSLVTPLPSPMGPGATVQFDIVITHAATSTLNAFNVVITDLIPAGLVNPQVVNVTSNGVTPVVSTGAFTAGELRVPISGDFDLPRGASVTTRISAQIGAAVQAAQMITNTAYVEWSSLPGAGTSGNPTGANTPGSPGGGTGERNGSGGVNDHRTSEPESLRIAADWGDLPDIPYATLAANDGARHLMLSSGNPYLGATVDSESNGQPNATATGDDAAGVPDDEDGIEFRTPLIPGAQAILRVTTGTPGFVSAFIDFDGNGTLDAVPVSAVSTLSGGVGTLPGSGFISDMAFSAAGVYDLTIGVPAWATGVQAARFRFTQNAGEGGANATGQAASGEVEDYVLMSLGNQLWFDNGGGIPANAYNGLFDSGEATAPAGVGLTLVISGATTPIATTTTDANGRYLFTGLMPGHYQVIVDAANFQSGGLLSGHVSTFTAEPDADSHGDNNDNGIDGDAASSGVSSSGVTLMLGQAPTDDGDSANSALTVDFGFVRQDWGDAPDTFGTTAGVAGPRHIITPGFYLGASVDSELNGQLTAVADGDDLTGTPDDEDGVVFVTPLVAGQPATITVIASGTGFLNAWIDFNGNGLFDADERVASDRALDGGANQVAVNVPANTTGVVVSRFRLTALAEQASTPIGVAPNGEVEDYVLASLGDFVWHDVDANGVQATGEGGVDNVTVRLLDGQGQPVRNAAGNPISTLTANHPTTGAAGWYEFPGLIPGAYQVEFVSPAGSLFTLANQNASIATEANDSDADRTTGRSATVTLVAGQANPDVDAGLVLPVTVGDRVWYDSNGDGLQDANVEAEAGVPDVVVTLYDTATQQPVLVNGQPLTAVTDADGLYRFENLPPGDYYVIFDLTTLPAGYVVTLQNVGEDNAIDSDADPTTGRTEATGFLASNQNNLTLDLGVVAPVHVGDYVWYDNNGDGLQASDSAAEPGVPGVRVMLYDATTQQPVLVNGQPLTAVTDADGLYRFENLPPGDYYVIFDLTTLPAGYVVTLQNVGEDNAIDSDADPTTGATTPTGFLPSGSEDLTLDMGLLAPDIGILADISVGDRVWYDNNGDGLQDANVTAEPGVPGVVVTIYDASRNEPVLVDEQPYTKTTDANGGYLFVNLPPGAYYVRFDLATLPAGHIPTTSNLGDDALDSDADRTSGQTAATPFLPSNTQNLTLDLGIYTPVTVGDRVWYDNNGDGLQDANVTAEPGVPGVVVTLYSTATGQPVIVNGQPLTDTTDASGGYLFGNLPPGDYYVIFDLTTLPYAYGVTQENAGDDTLDSDANPTTGQTGSTGFLTSGQENLTLDLGIVAPDLALIKTADSAEVQIGQVVRYTLAYHNSGHGAAHAVVVLETVPHYTTYVAAQSTPGWNCPDGAPGGTRCTYTLGAVGRDQGGRIAFAVQLASSVTPEQLQIRNVASILNDNGEPDDHTGNNESTADVAILHPTFLEPEPEPGSETPMIYQGFVFLPAVQR